MAVCTRASISRGAFEKLVDQGLVRLGLFCSQAAKPCEERRGDANRNEWLGVSRLGTTYAAGAPQFFIGGLRNVREINAAVQNIR
jgi:hypothetical protein